jgi:hypothetical protein|tara:strand:- start:170 stop:364 length:195 start_codon:yes stop_codon:yes gene_type:complete
MNTVYQCVALNETVEGYQQCVQWQAIPDYGGYKLTNEQMATFIFAIAALFATVAAIKIVRRTFF